MFIIDDVALARNAASLYLEGKPTNSLVDRVAELKIVDLAKARQRLRSRKAALREMPPHPVG
ncbi:MAG: hypothetical protein ACLQDM_29245 [Bradyrhizobium sp.]